MAKVRDYFVNTIEFIKNAITGFKPSTGPDLVATKVGLFKDTVSVEELRQMFKRDELLNAAVKRLASDVFDNWADIVVFKANGTINESATDSLKRLLDSLDLKRVSRAAFVSRLIHGFSVIGIGFPGSLEEPAASRSPRYLSVLPWSDIQEILIDLRPESERYGQPSAVRFDRNTGTEDGIISGSQTIDLHWTRFVNWVLPSIDGDNPEGMPGLLPLYDMLTVKKNVDWSLGESLYQYAVKHYVFQFPPTMPDDKYADVKKTVKDFNAVATFIYRGDPLTIHGFGGEGQLNPEPYVRYFTALLSIGLGVPYPILFRGLTGGASDVVQRDYASDVAAIQRNEVEPFLRQLFRQLGIDDTTLEFRWKPIIEMTQQEQAFITSRRSLARNLTAKAVDFYLNAGLAIEFDDDGFIKRVFVPDSKENILKLSPEQLAAVRLPKMPKDSPEEEEETKKMGEEDEKGGDDKKE